MRPSAHSTYRQPIGKTRKIQAPFSQPGTSLFVKLYPGKIHAKLDVWKGRKEADRGSKKERDWHFFPLEWSKQKAAKVIARRGGAGSAVQCLHIIYDKAVPSSSAFALNLFLPPPSSLPFSLFPGSIVIFLFLSLSLSSAFSLLIYWPPAIRDLFLCEKGPGHCTRAT